MGEWTYSPVDSFEAPPAVIGVGSVRRGFRSLVRRIRGEDRSGDSPIGDDDLLALPDDVRSRVVPPIDWHAAASGLQETLLPWLEADNPRKPVVFFVAPPHSGRPEILHEWASIAGAAVVPQPTDVEVAGNEKRWFRSWPGHGPWVLPRLEKCFIRDAEGLDLVGGILARVLSGEFGRGVVGCDSWAWAFLQHVWLGRPSYTITLDAIDHDRLARLLCPATGADGREPGPRFRRADNGADVLVDPSDEPRRGSIDAFLRHLAAYSRGNIGVAAAIWNSSLRTLPERDAAGAKDTHAERRSTVWVTPWAELDQPSIPDGAGEAALFVMHALLLHDGLAMDRLSAILPAGIAAVTEALIYLAEAGIVDEADGVWRVTPGGYPAVRARLHASDYLVDAF